MGWSKESRQSRGLGAEWERARRPAIERDKELCQPCLKAGRLTRYAEVDHIVPRAQAEKLGWSEARTNALSNLQCICKECHKAKTAAENGATYKPKVQIGVDGCPPDW